MEICVLIPIWKRQDLTNICFDYLAEQRRKFKFDVIVVGSEGANSEMLATGYGLSYTEFSNDHLGAKMNHALTKVGNYDAVVVLGSDDFLTDDAWRKFATLDLSGKTYYGFDHLYFYLTKNNSLSEFTYKGSNIKTVGAGRIYSRGCLESVDYKLWTDEKNFALDSDASRRLAEQGCKEVVLEGYHLVDVKHAENITGHAVARVGKTVDSSAIVKKFGLDLDEKLRSLVFIEGTEMVKKSRIKNRIMAKNVIIKMIVDGGGLVKDQEISTTEKAAKNLLRMKKAVLISEKSGFVPEKKEPCKNCDENKKSDERCIPCEQKDAENAKKLTENKEENGDSAKIQKPGSTKGTGKKGSKK